jgi:hypothetical protein
MVSTNKFIDNSYTKTLSTGCVLCANSQSTYNTSRKRSNSLNMGARSGTNLAVTDSLKCPRLVSTLYSSPPGANSRMM